MMYTHEVKNMCSVAKGPNHGPAPIPQEGKWVQAKEVKDISGLTHGVGWCAPQQGTTKLTLNVKDGIIQEALIETIGCSGMTHSAAMASEILPGKTILEALNTDLVCDAINTAMRELFLQIAYGRTQTAFSEDGLPVGAGLEDLGKGLRSQVGTMYGTLDKGPRYLEMAEGYVTEVALDEDDDAVRHLKDIAPYKVNTDSNRMQKEQGKVIINFASNFAPKIVDSEGHQLFGVEEVKAKEAKGARVEAEEKAPFFDGRKDKGTAAISYKVIDYGDNKIVRLSGAKLLSLELAPREEGGTGIDVTLETLKKIGFQNGWNIIKRCRRFGRSW